MTNVNLSSPWEIFRRKVEALFGADPGISFKWDENARELTMYVDDAEQAAALEALHLGGEHNGCTVQIIPANKQPSYAELLRRAFKTNPLFVDIVRSEGVFARLFVVFEPKPLQYYADDLTSPWGVQTRLPAEIARDIFGDSDAGGVFASNRLDGDNA